MSKFIAERVYRLTDENNDLIVCYVVHGDNKKAALLSLEENSSSEKKLEVETKIHKSQRSLEQNRLLWALLGKMANALSGNKRKVSTEECYCAMLEEANVSYDYLLALPEAEPSKVIWEIKLFISAKTNSRTERGQTLSFTSKARNPPS